jgi:hypothetical protein
MESPKVIIGKLFNNRIIFKPLNIPRGTEWLKWLSSEDLIEFTKELLRLVDQITKGKKDTNDLEIFLSEWHETALVNQEDDVLNDIMAAEFEIDAGKGKDWSVIKEEIGL